MALQVQIRSSQFGDDQLTSGHFDSGHTYATFALDSNAGNGAAAAANLADIAAEISTLQSAFESAIDGTNASLAAILGAGIVYDSATDLFSFGTIALTSSTATPNNWTAVITALDIAIKANATSISNEISRATGVEANLQTQITANDGEIAQLQTDLTNEISDRTNADTALANDIADLRGDVDATLGLTVADPSGIAGFAGTNYLTAATITSVFGAIEGLDSALDTIEQAMIASDQGLQANMDTLESNVESRLGISDIADASAFNLSSSAYLQSANDVSSALSILDAAIHSNDGDISGLVADLAQEITDRTNADAGLASDIANLQTELNDTQTSLGFTNTAYSNSGTYIGQGATNTVKSDISALDTAVQANATSIANLGSAFNYVGTVAGAANATSATDLSALSETDTGDYYKVNAAGYFEVANGTPFYANLNDGLVFNNAGGVDIIDNTNSDIQVSGQLTITGSADAGFNISSAVIDGKVATNEGDIASLQTFTGEGTALDTSAGDLAAAINELHGEIVTNDGDIAQLNTDLTALEGRVTINEGDITALQSGLAQEITDRTNADTALQGQITSNDGDISQLQTDLAAEVTRATGAETALDARVTVNEGDISALQTNQHAIETSVGLPASGTKTDFDSDGSGNVFNITAGGSLKDAIEELDASLEQSSTAPIDTGRLTVAPMSHQYANYQRLQNGSTAGDLVAYSSKTIGASASSLTGNGIGSGDLQEFHIPSTANSVNMILPIGSMIANAPTMSFDSTKSHLINNMYWYTVRVYKNGIRMIQRNETASLQGSDEYKISEVKAPVGNFPTTWGDYDSDDQIVRFPIKIPSRVESQWRVAWLNDQRSNGVSEYANNGSAWAIGDTDPDARQPHPLAGQKNHDETVGGTHPLNGSNNPDADMTRYYKITFGNSLGDQDIITIDYMGLKD